MIPAWASEYVGLPFVEHGRDRHGLDCWGLARLVLLEQFGLELPAYSERYASTKDHEEIGRLVRGELAPWREVPRGAERAGDMVLLRIMGQPCHVGLVVAPGFMLHIEEGIDSVLEGYVRHRWRRRILGFYRHEALANE